jgi:hypothetical protein
MFVPVTDEHYDFGGLEQPVLLGCEAGRVPDSVWLRGDETDPILNRCFWKKQIIHTFGNRWCWTVHRVLCSQCQLPTMLGITSCAFV